jgi:hypothetical protein
MNVAVEQPLLFAATFFCMPANVNGAIAATKSESTRVRRK